MERVAAPDNGQATYDPFALMKGAFIAMGPNVYRWCVLLMAFLLFGYSAWRPNVLSLLAAAIFTLLVLVPLAWRERR
jgi:hypothetical protein